MIVMSNGSYGAVPAAVAALLLGGCGGPAGASDGGTSTVAAFYPLGWVAEQVGGERVDVALLTSPGVEPHDLELTPEQVVQVADAGVVVTERGFQPAVDDAVAQEVDGTVVDAADEVDLVATAGGETDPHFWHDPVRMAQLARAVGAAYADIDPEGARTYEAATADVVARLRQLDADYRAALRGCTTTTVVTSHDAFGYLAERYGLTVLPIAGLDAGAEPTPERLAELSDLVRAEGVTTVFTEPLVSPDAGETLASEAGLRVDTLDPIEGVTDETADDDYLSLMRANLAALVEANGC